MWRAGERLGWRGAVGARHRREQRCVRPPQAMCAQRPWGFRGRSLFREHKQRRGIAGEHSKAFRLAGVILIFMQKAVGSHRGT